METQDLTDYYNLTAYVSRFVKNPKEIIAYYFSQVTVLNRLEILEKKNGNTSFREESIPTLIEKIDSDELLDVAQLIDILSLTSIFISEDGDVYADGYIYSDFVGYLTLKGINV